MINKKKVKLIIAIFIIASISFAFDSQELAMINQIRKVCPVVFDGENCKFNNRHASYSPRTKIICLDDKFDGAFSTHKKQVIIHEFVHFLCYDILPQEKTMIKSKNKNYKDQFFNKEQEVIADAISIICVRKLFEDKDIITVYREILGDEEFFEIANTYKTMIATYSTIIINYLQEDL